MFSFTKEIQKLKKYGKILDTTNDVLDEIKESETETCWSNHTNINIIEIKLMELFYGIAQNET